MSRPSTPSQSGPRRQQGRRVGLSREAIVVAAIDLADESGPEAVSMRRLAAVLGVEPMTLYHYVPNKEALFDGMVEQVIASSTPTSDLRDWRGSLRAYAARLLESLGAHPGVVPLLAARPALTPGTAGTIEAVLAVMRDDGIAPSRGLEVIRTLTGLVLGHATVSTMTAEVADMSPSAVDRSGTPLLAEAMGDAAPPHALFDRTVESLLDVVADEANTAPPGGVRPTSR